MRHDADTSPIRVLVCDDTRVHTEVLADALKRDGSLQVLTSTSGADSVLTHLNHGNVDVLLISATLDHQPGRGFELVRGLRADNADLKAVMLLDASHPEMVVEAFRAGARGIFDKNDSVETLSKCLRRVHENQIWASSRHMTALVDALASSHTIRAVDARGLNLLSKRETEIVGGVAQGLSNREIADRLSLSQHTIKNSLFRIFDKLGVSSRVELLFMTLTQERYAESGLRYLVNDRAYESLRDEAALVACEDAAKKGVLTAQIALAQFYATHKGDLSAAVKAYMWCLRATGQVATLCKSLAKELTPDQLLEAEVLATESRLEEPNGDFSLPPRPPRLSPRTQRRAADYLTAHRSSTVNG